MLQPTAHRILHSGVQWCPTLLCTSQTRLEVPHLYVSFYRDLEVGTEQGKGYKSRGWRMLAFMSMNQVLKTDYTCTYCTEKCMYTLYIYTCSLTYMYIWTGGVLLKYQLQVLPNWIYLT